MTILDVREVSSSFKPVREGIDQNEVVFSAPFENVCRQQCPGQYQFLCQIMMGFVTVRAFNGMCILLYILVLRDLSISKYRITVGFVSCMCDCGASRWENVHSNIKQYHIFHSYPELHVPPPKQSLDLGETEWALKDL